MSESVHLSYNNEYGLHRSFQKALLRSSERESLEAAQLFIDGLLIKSYKILNYEWLLTYCNMKTVETERVLCCI